MSEFSLCVEAKENKHDCNLWSDISFNNMLILRTRPPSSSKSTMGDDWVLEHNIQKLPKRGSTWSSLSVFALQHIYLHWRAFVRWGKYESAESTSVAFLHFLWLGSRDRRWTSWTPFHILSFVHNWWSWKWLIYQIWWHARKLWFQSLDSIFIFVYWIYSFFLLRS